MTDYDYEKKFEKTPKIELEQPRSIRVVSAPKNCIKIDGKYFAVDIKDKEEIIYQNIRIYKNNHIKDIENGVYTWILTQSLSESGKCDGPFNLYFNKVLTPIEVGTLHSNLISRIDDICSIRLAGEFKKTDNKFEYNFLSGTYMAGNISDEYIDEIKVAFVDYVGNHLSTGIINKFTYSNLSTLITEENFGLSLIISDLKFLYDLGIRIVYFENAKDCRQYDNYSLELVKYEMKLESYNKNPKYYPEPINPIKPRGIDFKNLIK